MTVSSQLQAWWIDIGFWIFLPFDSKREVGCGFVITKKTLGLVEKVDENQENTAYN